MRHVHSHEEECVECAHCSHVLALCAHTALRIYFPSPFWLKRSCQRPPSAADPAASYNSGVPPTFKAKTIVLPRHAAKEGAPA